MKNDGSVFLELISFIPYFDEIFDKVYLKLFSTLRKTGIVINKYIINILRK